MHREVVPAGNLAKPADQGKRPTGTVRVPEIYDRMSAWTLLSTNCSEFVTSCVDKHPLISICF